VSERVVRLAEALLEHEVRAVFGISGSGLSLQLITALEQRGVPFYTASHEAAAAIMAGAAGWRTGTLGCSLSIRGPGLGNALAGILTNHYEQRAALSIAEALGPLTPAGMMHKRLEHAGALAFCSKAYATLGEPRETLAGLATAARAEIPGPVHLDLFAEDAPALRVSASAPAAEGRAGDAVRRLVERAARPVLVVGGLATRRRWGARLARLRVPVFTTFAAKGVIDERLPFAAGVFTGDGKARSPEARVLPEADLVVGLGLRNLEILRPRAFPCPAVVVDLVDGVAEGFAATHVWRTDGDEPFEELLSLLEARCWGESVVTEATAEVRRALLADPWLPGAVYDCLERELPGVGCFVADAGWFCTVAEHVWRATSPTAFLASANGRSMGTGLPMAIGAALADRAQPTVCAMGDGGVRMYVADVKLAVEERLPILFLLLSDGRLGSLAGASGLSRRATTVAGPSWFRVAEAMDCAAQQVKDVDGLVAALRRWRWREGPMFIEAVFDPERYAAMTREIR